MDRVFAELEQRYGAKIKTSTNKKSNAGEGPSKPTESFIGSNGKLIISSFFRPQIPASILFFLLIRFYANGK